MAKIKLTAKECYYCEGQGMLYADYGPNFECGKCNATGKILTANIEGALYKVKLYNFEEQF